MKITFFCPFWCERAAEWELTRRLRARAIKHAAAAAAAAGTSPHQHHPCFITAVNFHPPLFQPGIMGLSHSLSCVVLLSARHVRICDGRASGRTDAWKEGAITAQQCPVATAHTQWSQREQIIRERRAPIVFSRLLLLAWLRTSTRNGATWGLCVGFGLCGLN